MKKKPYNVRVLEIENGSFTPLVVSVKRGMGSKAKRFYARLVKMFAENRDVPVSVATLFMRTKISSSLLKATLFVYSNPDPSNNKKMLSLKIETLISQKKKTNIFIFVYVL